MFHWDLPQFPLPCNTPCNYRTTKTTQHFGWPKDVESFSLWPPRDPTTDQWKTSILLFLLHLHPWGFAVLWILVARILPLLCSCLQASLILERKNKMLTKCITSRRFLSLRVADAGQRWREQPILSAHPGELSPNHKTKENSKVKSRSYYWLPQLRMRGRDKPGLKIESQANPNSMRLFSLWCVWKHDKWTTLNTELLVLLSTIRDAEPWDRSHAAASTNWPAWKLAEHESKIFLPCAKTSKDRFLRQLSSHPPPYFCRQAHKTVYKLCHLVPCKQMMHSSPCTSLHTRKFGHPLGIWKE